MKILFDVIRFTEYYNFSNFLNSFSNSSFDNELSKSKGLIVSALLNASGAHALHGQSSQNMSSACNIAPKVFMLCGARLKSLLEPSKT
ncbi:hypothetical protein TZ54_02580 [Clostridioides difficile]|nr:hypothetical protein [Clostridioides difficile]KJF64985.1 hypothetical protein TZ54_02580 [Clostridioides difficile]